MRAAAPLGGSGLPGSALIWFPSLSQCEWSVSPSGMESSSPSPSGSVLVGLLSALLSLPELVSDEESPSSFRFPEESHVSGILDDRPSAFALAATYFRTFARAASVAAFTRPTARIALSRSAADRIGNEGLPEAFGMAFP